MLLVTGASGFIGAHALASATARGFEVHPLRSATIDLLGDPAEVRERVAAIGATHLLHLAWYAVPGKFWTAEENFRWVTATMALMEGFAQGGGRRFVAAGTCAEYDWTQAGVCNERTTPLQPATTYGIAKDATRRLLAAYAHQRGLSFAWGRIFMPYGPGEHPDRLVASVIGALLNGGRAAVTEGTQRRDLLHVRDVADAFVALVASDVTGAVNIGSGNAVALRDVVGHIANELGASDRVDYGALPMRSDDPPLLVADVTRLRDEVQWAPSFDLVSGLRDTIEWRKHH